MSRLKPLNLFRRPSATSQNPLPGAEGSKTRFRKSAAFNREVRNTGGDKQISPTAHFKLKSLDRFFAKVHDPQSRLLLKVLHFFDKLGFSKFFLGSKDFLIPEPVRWGREESDVVKPNLRETENMWKRFAASNTAYLLIYPNPGGGYGEHVAMVLGSSKDTDMHGEDNYVSWTFDKGNPLSTQRHRSSFAHEHQDHGNPEVIPLKGLNVKKMKQAWEELREKNGTYNLLSLNCSKVAHTIIQAGIEDKDGDLRKVRRTGSAYYTPADMRGYGYRLQQRLKYNRQARIMNSRVAKLRGNRWKPARPTVSRPLHVRKIGVSNIYQTSKKNLN